MDRLSVFFSQLSLSARVFFSGQLCGTSGDHGTGTAGHLHVVRNGVIKIIQPVGPPVVMDQPVVLLYPRPERHTFRSEGADIICAFVEFGAGTLNPLVSALPNMLIVPISSMPELASIVDLLFAEAFSKRDGRQAAVDRLAEYFLILLLRFAIESQLLEGGVLTAFSDPRLSKAIDAIHQQPERHWSLDQLAHVAGMSRARFAAHFLFVTGQTPFQYLALWRIGVAQSLLKKGQPLKLVAPHIGYANSGALTRAFSKHIGVTPMTWLAAQSSTAT